VEGGGGGCCNKEGGGEVIVGEGENRGGSGGRVSMKKNLINGVEEEWGRGSKTHKG